MLILLGQTLPTWSGGAGPSSSQPVRTGRSRRSVALRAALDSLQERPLSKGRTGSSIRPSSIRPDGLEGAGLRYSDASLASTTGPVFSADDLPEGQILRPAQAIKGLYAAFNARDAACAASFLADECVYEDLLLGPATVCRGKEAFMNALNFHPAFVSSRIFDGLPFADLLPELTLEVDSIAEGTDTVGVEWHVMCGSSDFPLGRGLSQARVCTTTGKIVRVVDIAEAPWRVIGLIALPFIGFVQRVQSLLVQPGSDAQDPRAEVLAGPSDELASPAGTPGAASTASDVEREYGLLLGAVLADGLVHRNERAMLASYAAENRVSDAQHAALLARAGWSEDEYSQGFRDSEEVEQL